MAIDDELKKLIHQLVHRNTGEIALNGSNICVRLFEEDAKISLGTQVYFGGNYIPKSVRSRLSVPSPFHHPIKTYLTVDEPNFQISLNYVGKLDNLDRKNFKDLLVEFSWVAEEWRNILDEHDKQDLVHVHVI